TYSLDGFTINLDGSCSTGDVAHWAWYINGDFFSDDGPEAHHTVIEAGTYVICLITTTASGCIDTVCEEIHVEQQQGDCEACFTYSLDGFTINLDGSCSTGDVAHWAWYINGDFFSDDGPEAHHTVIEAGTYVICLITTTASGCIDTVCEEIHVEQQGDCEACFTYSLDGFTINLDGSCSTGDVAHWAWYINGDFFSDDGPESHHTVTEAGTFVICLITTTASGCIDTACEEIHIEQQQGDCEACFSYWLDNFTIHLDGSCSAGDVTHWSWYINGDFFSDAGPDTHHEVNDAGEYEICLIIETGGGCIDTFCDHITVEDFQGGDYDFKVMPPNPDGNLVFQITSPSQGFFTLSVYDIMGRRVLEQKNDLPTGISQFTVLTGKQLPPECYFVTINFNGESTRTNKVMMLK
ncbi:MAG TPA: T9SS type A sorting domain-containing protein, partial [Chitinophagales bacterium]|nr:T9SS type A sorting domain-containing protein [Chitinophagales bacterium]